MYVTSLPMVFTPFKLMHVDNISEEIGFICLHIAYECVHVVDNSVEVYYVGPLLIDGVCQVVQRCVVRIGGKRFESDASGELFHFFVATNSPLRCRMLSGLFLTF